MNSHCYPFCHVVSSFVISRQSLHVAMATDNIAHAHTLMAWMQLQCVAKETLPVIWLLWKCTGPLSYGMQSHVTMTTAILLYILSSTCATPLMQFFHLRVFYNYCYVLKIRAKSLLSKYP